MSSKEIYNRRARGVRPARRVRRASSPRQYTTVVKCLVVVPVEEEECEGGGDQEGEHLVGVRGRIRVRVWGRGRGSGRVGLALSSRNSAVPKLETPMCLSGLEVRVRARARARAGARVGVRVRVGVRPNLSVPSFCSATISRHASCRPATLGPIEG